MVGFLIVGHICRQHSVATRSHAIFNGLDAGLEFFSTPASVQAH